MSKNNELFDLIKSMNGSEKRFFKIQSKRHVIGEKNNYLKLFELFDQFKEFDETSIIKAAKRAKFVKYFAAEKNQLYNSILDSLDVFHKTSSIDREIGKMINQGRILLEKKLEFQGEKILQKARKLSMEQHRHEYLLTINHLLVRKAFDKETLTEKFLEQTHLEEMSAIGNLSDKLEFRHAFDLLHLTRRRHGDISESTHLNQITRSFPFLSDPQDVIKLIQYQKMEWDARVYYLLARVEFCRMSRKRDELATLAHTLIEEMENKRSRITGEFIDRYSYALYVMLLMNSFCTQKERSEAFAKLRHLEQYLDAKVTKREHARTFEYHTTTTTDNYLKTKNYHHIIPYLEEMEPAEKQYAGHITPSFNVALHYNIAALFFNMGEYRSALKWGNKISMAAISFRKDIYHFLRTLNLLIHLELSNEDMLLSLMNTISYHNKRNKVDSALQRSLIKHVKRLLKTNKSEHLPIYESLKSDLLKFSKMPTENVIFEDLDLLGWIDGKVGGCRGI